MTKRKNTVSRLSKTLLKNGFPLKKKLPTTLSGWIYEAVKDARLLEKTPGFELNMGAFNTLSGGRNTCYVCLGGAAIVGSGLVGIGESIGDDEFINNVAFALDYVRNGEIRKALEELGFVRAILGPDIEVGNNYQYRAKMLEVQRISDSLRDEITIIKSRAPWSAYLKAARDLKAIGY